MRSDLAAVESEFLQVLLQLRDVRAVGDAIADRPPERAVAMEQRHGRAVHLVHLFAGVDLFAGHRQLGDCAGSGREIGGVIVLQTRAEPGLGVEYALGHLLRAQRGHIHLLRSASLPGRGDVPGQRPRPHRHAHRGQSDHGDRRDNHRHDSAVFPESARFRPCHDCSFVRYRMAVSLLGRGFGGRAAGGEFGEDFVVVIAEFLGGASEGIGDVRAIGRAFLEESAQFGFAYGAGNRD